jgi:hypothetical protein
LSFEIKMEQTILNYAFKVHTGQEVEPEEVLNDLVFLMYLFEREIIGFETEH